MKLREVIVLSLGIMAVVALVALSIYLTFSGVLDKQYPSWVNDIIALASFGFLFWLFRPNILRGRKRMPTENLPMRVDIELLEGSSWIGFAGPFTGLIEAKEWLDKRYQTFEIPPEGFKFRFVLMQPKIWPYPYVISEKPTPGPASKP